MKKLFLLLLSVSVISNVFAQYKFLGSYTSDGTPLYFSANDIVSIETMNLVHSALPEGYPVPVYNPQYISSGYDTDIILQDSADVWVTFVDEGAGYKNVLGFYTYNINNPLTVVPASSAITIIFPNVSKAGSGGSLIAGNKVKIGTFSKNTGIGFILIADGWRSGVVSNGNWKLYSNPNFNPETNTSLRYHNVLISDSTNKRIILGFEDIRRDNSSCDNDFNDALFYISASPYTAIKTSNFTNIEDSYSTVSSGNSGGLESNGRLADKIAKRFFERIKNNSEKESRKEFQLKLTDSKSVASSVNGSNNPTGTSVVLSSYFPLTGMFGDEVPYVSTPNDLLNITNAIEVFSTDYYRNNERVAAALVTHTLDEVYDHTKLICDRLNGASLEDVRTIELNGYKLINTKFKSAIGETEYCITFSVKILESDYSLYSLWSIEQYSAGEYLNYQVWGNSMGEVCSITNNILLQLQNERPMINNSTDTKIPDVFIKQGVYKDGKLNLNICNKKSTKSIQFNGNIRNTETDYLKNMAQTIALSGTFTEEVVVNSGYIFDIGFSISCPESQQADALYLADGAWGIDYQESLVADLRFNVAANNSHFNATSLKVERNPEVKGKIKGTLNLFRNAKTGNSALNISDYKNISFDIVCNKPIELVLTDSSLDNWDNRARFSIAATPVKRTITIPLSSFKNNKGEKVSLDAIKTIVFSLNGDYKNFTDFNVAVSEVNFNNDNAAITNVSGKSYAFPNPFVRYTTLVFSTEQTSGILRIIDAAGRIVMNREIEINNHEYSLDATSLKSGIYFFTLTQNSTISNSGKFIMQ